MQEYSSPLEEFEMTSPHETLVAPKPGQAAPEFSLPTYPKGNISLSQFRGVKNVILAFYPKDDTPGCTKEMCSFSDDLSRFEAANTEILGISCDSEDAHEKFAAKYNLKQKLLVDADGKVGKMYGTVQEGKSTASRVLFVIDKNGVVRHVTEGMPDNAQLLELVKGL
jgi:thioredoxin-dependent peroxiredoxin